MITVTYKSGIPRNTQMPDKSDYMIVNWRLSTHPLGWRPPTDVYELEDNLTVRVEIAGMNEDDFSISLNENILLIRGTRPDTNERRAYHQMEINFGEFICVVDIQVPIDTEHVQAEYQNGFLWIILPKAQSKTIQIKENE